MAATDHRRPSASCVKSRTSVPGRANTTAAPSGQNQAAWSETPQLPHSPPQWSGCSTQNQITGTPPIAHITSATQNGARHERPPDPRAVQHRRVQAVVVVVVGHDAIPTVAAAGASATVARGSSAGSLAARRGQPPPEQQACDDHAAVVGAVLPLGQLGSSRRTRHVSAPRSARATSTPSGAVAARLFWWRLTAEHRCGRNVPDLSLSHGNAQTRRRRCRSRTRSR